MEIANKDDGNDTNDTNNNIKLYACQSLVYKWHK